MIVQKENELASPQSQPVHNKLSNASNFTDDWLQSPTDGVFHLACGDGSRMGQVTEWTTNWDDFSGSLSVPEVGEKQGTFWCAANYGGSTQRIRDNVQGVSLIVLDVEAKPKQPPPPAAALALCAGRGWQAFAHTTYTHKPNAPRYRLCMVPSRTIKPNELRRLVEVMAQELDLECACDLAASGDPARLYYTPRVASEIGKDTFEHGAVKGAAVDVDKMLELGRAERAKPAPAPASQISKTGQLSDDLRSALEYLDPDSYDSWLAGLMALKTAPISNAQELAHWWSAKSAKYHCDDCQTKWDSLQPRHTSYKEIFKKAQRLGWVNPASGKYEFDFSSLLGQVDSKTGEIGPLLKPISVADVITNPSPPPEFIWDGYLPRGVVSLLGAHGGTGKSTIALMLGVCAALGRPLFGVDTVQCKTLFVSLEDSAHIVRHRLAFICNLWGINPAALDGKLLIVDGTENPELFSADNRGAGGTTATYFEMRKLVQLEEVGLVVVDNASDAYGGDEIQRRQVRAFIRALVEVARLTDCAVVLLAHVDKNTSRARKAEGGEGYSGSTAWHNSARSRLFMTRTAMDTLTLEHQKSNLGRCREPLTLEWLDAGLPQLIGNNPADNPLNPFLQRLEGRAEDERAISLLRMVAEFETRQQYCSPVATARNNVFAMLKSEPAFQKLKLNADGCKRIVNQCQRAKWIEPLDYRTHDRKTRARWTLTTGGRAIAGLSAPSAPCTNESAESAESAVSAPCAPCA